MSNISIDNRVEGEREREREGGGIKTSGNRISKVQKPSMLGLKNQY